MRVKRREFWLDPVPLTIAFGITAVAWHFTQQMLPEIVPAASFPSLAAMANLIPQKSLHG